MMTLRLLILAFPLLLVVIGLPQTAVKAQNTREWYVATNGSPSNDGTIANPIDLATALNGQRVKSGATVWLRGGTYRGVFKSLLTGTPDAPITVRQYPGERAIIADERERAGGATLNVFGAWTIYRDFEVTNLHEIRRHHRDFRPAGLEIEAPNTKFINLLVYDTGIGFAFWKGAVNSELYGNLIFNTGTENIPADRRHGHGIYTQNENGTKLIRDNIIVNPYGFGLHAYPDPGGVVGYRFEGNVIADSGGANPPSSGSYRHSNLLILGKRPYPVDRVEFIDNYTYHSSRDKLSGHWSESNMCLGCEEGLAYKSVVITGNYLAGGNPVAVVGNWERVTMTGNTFVGFYGMADVRAPSLATWRWDENTYMGSGPPRHEHLLFAWKGRPLSFEDWVKQTGFDRSSQYRAGKPAGTRVFVRPNAYEKGRAHIVVYNWDRSNAVQVDLASVLARSSEYEIRNAMDYFGPPVTTGTFDGSPVRVPLQALRVARPRGETTGGSTNGEFSVFVVTSGGNRTPVKTTSAPAVQPPARLPSSATPNRAALPTPGGAGPRMRANLISLQPLIRHFVTADRSGEVSIEIADDGLQARMLSEPGRPAYVLSPAGANRFRLVGTPEGYYATFSLSGADVRSLTVERGRQPSVILYPVPLTMFVRRFSTADRRQEVSIELTSEGLRATMSTESNKPSYLLQPVSSTRYRLAGTPEGFYANFSIRRGEVESVTFERGSAAPVTLYPR